jgi:ABC-2 type transport system permease protein
VRQALAIASRDLRSTYLTPFGVGCTAGFAAFAGVLLVVDLRGDEARLDGWFAPLYVVVGLLAALLTMRSFAEEERTGSLELLLTAPLRSWQVVTGKLLGVAGGLLGATAATVACPLLVMSMGNPDGGPIITGYIGVVLLGAAFLAIGLAVSAATGNPLAAAVGTAAVLLGLWGMGVVATGLTGRLGRTLSYLAPSSHVTGFLRGTLALTDVVYFLSFTALGLLAAVAVLRSRR